MTLSLCIPWQAAESNPGWYGRVLELLQPVSWYNHKFDQTAEPHNVPMLFSMRDDAYMFEAVPVARRNKHRLWLLGNEPERPAISGGSETDPQTAADAVHRWQERTDNPIAVPGILWDSEGEGWLEKYLQANGPIPEMWHIHIYAHSAGHWLVLWQEWKEWMQEHHLELPTIVSECSSWDEDARIQGEVMGAVRQTLRTDKWLHSAYWFSACYGPWVDFWLRSDLLDEDGKLTEVGKHYADVQPAGLGMNIYLPMTRRS